MIPLRTLSLFAGIGGFDLGLERTRGFQIVAQCEKDEYCQKVLKKHWPHVPCVPDIFNLTGSVLREFGPIDAICGGFPCQPYSVAGRQGGAADHRHLWPQMFRVIRESGAWLVIGENVPGIVGMELDNVLSDLESAGFTCQTFDIPACAIDARHRRRRIWIVAYSDRLRKQREAETGIEYGYRTLDSSEAVSDAQGERLQGQRSSGQQVTGAHGGSGLSLCGGSDGAEWPVEPNVGRVANGIPRRMDRLRGLGNAVDPQISEAIARLVLHAYTHWDDDHGK
jgi:DNA (cytosine-5)-methyltransferase 1